MTEQVTAKRRSKTTFFMKIRQQQVILTASICMIALAIILKNVLFVPADILIRDMMMYIIVYFGFLIFAFKIDGNYKKSGKITPLVWDILIVLITVAIVAVYAVK